MSVPSDSEVAAAVYPEFLTRGFDDASMSRVSEALGIKPEALAERFPSKYDLWFMALCEALDSLAQALDSSEPGPALERLRRACETYVEFGLSHPLAYRFIYMPRSAAMPSKEENPAAVAPGNISSRATMLRHVRRCIREGIFPEQSPELALQGLWCGLHGCVEMLLNMNRIAWSRELRDEVIETYLVGLQHRTHTLQKPV
jgi:AcrR family transcriptional regulator